MNVSFKALRGGGFLSLLLIVGLAVSCSTDPAATQQGGMSLRKIRKALRSTGTTPADNGRRGRAYKSIEEMGDEATVLIPDLKEMLTDPDRSIRSHAQAALGRMKEVAEPLVPYLIGLLEHEDSGTRVDSIKALGRIGPSAVPAVPLLIQRAGGEEGALYAIKALGEIGPLATEAVPYLLRVLEAEHEKRRAYAATALGKIEDLRALEPLIKGLEEKRLHGEAAVALGRLGDNRAFEPLLGRLQDPASKFLTLAGLMRAFGDLDDERALQYLKAYLQKEPYQGMITMNATRSIVQIEGKESIPFFTALLDHKDSQVTSEVTRRLDEMGWRPGTAEEKIRYLFGRSRYEEAGLVGEEVIPFAVAGLRDSNSYRREKCAAVLEKRGWETALAHGLLSAYTAFVAVDSSRPTGGSYGISVRVPVPVPDGVRYDTTVRN